MTKAAALIAQTSCSREPVAGPTSAKPRPGWVLELVAVALASAEQPLRPQQVIQLANRLHGRQVAPSSVRNALRLASQRHDHPIERFGHGLYRLRR